MKEDWINVLGHLYQQEAVALVTFENSQKIVSIN